MKHRGLLALKANTTAEQSKDNAAAEKLRKHSGRCMRRAHALAQRGNAVVKFHAS
ncbi:MAG: hypothetical protein KC503_25610 [Myxococcales bacterium]|nr:hypothetical protein [Myxococcales bacterium]